MYNFQDFQAQLLERNPEECKEPTNTPDELTDEEKKQFENINCKFARNKLGCTGDFYENFPSLEEGKHIVSNNCSAAETVHKGSSVTMEVTYLLGRNYHKTHKVLMCLLSDQHVLF